MKIFIVFAMTVLSFSKALAFDDRFTLVARAGVEPYKLPFMSSLSNTNPQGPKEGLLIFKFWGYSDVTMETTQRFWLYDTNLELGRELFDGGGQWHLSDPFLTKNSAIYTLSNFGVNGGIYEVDLDTSQSTLVVDPKDFVQVIAKSSAGQLSDGSYYWRSTTREGVRLLGMKRPGQTAAHLLSEGDQLFSCELTYLFSPYSAGEYLVFKARLLCEGEEVMAVVRFHRGEFHVMASDRTGLGTLKFSSINNNLSVNRYGQVAILGRSESAGPALFLLGAGQGEVVPLNDSVGALETFAPSLNSRGEVAFRSLDRQGLRAQFYRAPGREVVRLIGEGDLIPLEAQGTARVLHSSWGPGFAGAPSLGDSGEIVFSAVLEEKEGGERLGSAIYIVRP